MRDLTDFFSSRNFASTTLSNYTKRIEHFTNYLSKRMNLPQNEIDLSQMIQVVDARGDLITHRPINGRILDEYFQEVFIEHSYSALIISRNVLVSFFLFLERNYQFPNPIRELTFNFKIIKPVSKHPITMSRHEILKLLNAIVTHSTYLTRDLLLFCLLLSTGKRISEIIGLKIEHFDFRYNTFKLEKTKSKRESIVPMMSGMGEVIELYSEKNGLCLSSYLFKNNKGRPFHRTQVAKLFHKYCDLSGIKRYKIHAARKTFATLLYEEGVDISIIQQLLDHVRGDTTQIYVNSGYVRNYGLKLKANQSLYSKFKESNSEVYEKRNDK